MLRHSLVVFTVLITIASTTHASEVVLPKSLIIELVDAHCSSPKPNPNINAALNYDCYENETQGGEFYNNYELTLVPLSAQDYNKDGVSDIAVEVRSLGALGGNVHTNSAIHYLLLNSDKKVINEHKILLYAPLSDNIVDYEVNNLGISYRSIPNFRVHPEAYNYDGEPLKPPIKFTLNWLNNLPVSSYYQNNCRLFDKVKDGVFKQGDGVVRHVDIDMQDYTQVIKEKLQIANIKASATSSGCNENIIVFEIEPINDQSLPVLADVLQALIPVTNYDQQLKQLLSLDKDSLLNFSEKVPLSDGWAGQVLIDRNVDSAAIKINLYKAQ